MSFVWEERYRTC